MRTLSAGLRLARRRIVTVADREASGCALTGLISYAARLMGLRSIQNYIGIGNSSDAENGVDPAPVQAELAPALSQILSQANPTELNFLARADVVAPIRVWGKQRGLRFESEIREKRFQEEHVLIARGVLQVLLPVSIVLYAVYHLWGVLLDVGYGKYVFITRAVVLVILFCLLLAIRSDWFLRNAQLYTYSISMSGFAGAAMICYIVDNGFERGLPALGVIITACVTSDAMLVRTAAVFCFSAFLLTNTLILLDTDPGNSLKYVLVNTNFILFSYCLFSLLTCYHIEMHLRHRFRFTGTISYWTNPDMLDGEDEDDRSNHA